MSCGVVAPKDSDKKCWQWTCMMFEISLNSFFNPRLLFLSLLATSFSNINIDTDIIFITKFHRILQPHAPLTHCTVWAIWSWFYPVKSTYGIDYFWVVNIWPTFLFFNLRIKERFHDTKSINKEIKNRSVYIDNSLVYICIYSYMKCTHPLLTCTLFPN